MKKTTYDCLIKQNIAFPNSKKIVVYNQKKKKVGEFGLQNLKFPDLGEKLYSFGAISDIHLQYSTAHEDFVKALEYLNDVENVAFTCICGDLTASGTTEQLEDYKNYVDTYSSDTPVYAITGNHESWGGLELESVISDYTGQPLYYSFAHGDDVFIMVGIQKDGEGVLFVDGELQWLYETLEINRNKRCFIFEHVRPQDGCGNAYGIYNYDIWGGTEATIFESLMSHYKNAHLFHGHSHLKFNLQTKDNMANIDRLFGGWSIHIPSLAVPRTGDVTGANSRQEIYADSEGYIVDVYKDGIHLRGRDFVKDEFLPIASYWLDTTLKEIEANAYADETGTIKT